MQQINETEMKQPQYMLSMKQPPIRHEVSIITIMACFCYYQVASVYIQARAVYN